MSVVNTTDNQRPRAPRVLFFGMQSTFSALVLQALLTGGVTVSALVLPATSLPGSSRPPFQPYQTLSPGRRSLSMAETSQQSSIVQIAQQHTIPIWEVYRLHATETLSTLAGYQPDLLCVACFPRRIPRALCDLPRLGGLNVHPSLLPANRGPVPLFWTLREGHTVTGVTIHALAHKLDSGAIFAQEALRIPEGIRSTQLEYQCAQLGAKLLTRVVWEIFRGNASTQPQDEAKSSYHSFPGEADFVVQASSWTAHHLYNFIRGVHDWHHPITLQLEHECIVISDAISYSTGKGEEGIARPESHPGTRVVACQDGWVTVVVDASAEAILYC